MSEWGIRVEVLPAGTCVRLWLSGLRENAMGFARTSDDVATLDACQP